MKLFTFVPCNAVVRAIPAHQTYYYPSYFSPPSAPAAWAFVGYRVSADKHENTALYLSYVAYVGLQHYTAIPTATPPSWEKNPKCGVLVVLPWSDLWKRPFHIPADAAQVGDVGASTLTIALLAWLFLFLIWLVIIVPSSVGEDGRCSRCFATMIAWMALDAALFLVLVIGEGDTIKDAISYYKFFDQLPRAAGDLLPLSWSQMHTLISGPPYPTAASFTASKIFLGVLAVSCLGWLTSSSYLIFAGLCYWFGPDPVGDMQRQAHAEGRPVSQDDLIEMIMNASGTMNTRELAKLKGEMQKRITHVK